jgi:tRNA A37 methylthiotransferase MiaB
MGTPFSLLDAVGTVDAVPGDFRIRLGSLEPTLITPEFIGGNRPHREAVPPLPSFAQSGCDAPL